jgi:hypothetical protein
MLVRGRGPMASCRMIGLDRDLRHIGERARQMRFSVVHENSGDGRDLVSHVDPIDSAGRMRVAGQVPQQQVGLVINPRSEVGFIVRTAQSDDAIRDKLLRRGRGPNKAHIAGGRSDRRKGAVLRPPHHLPLSDPAVGPRLQYVALGPEIVWA